MLTEEEKKEAIGRYEATCIRCIHVSVCHASWVLEVKQQHSSEFKDEILAWGCRFWKKDAALFP